MDPYPYLLRTWFYINFYKTFLSVLKVAKTSVFYLRTPYEYLARYGQGSIFTTDPWKRILKMDSCPKLFKYCPDVPKKETKEVLDIFKIRTINVL